ncbi:MAG: TfoX/Sxy family protein [Candidatus Cloacimonadales bacterium]
MATDKDMLNYILEQINNAGEIRYLKMFGEYTIYSDDKIFALVSDNKLFIKPTLAGREFIKNVTEAPPYPGAKNYFLIEEELEDSEWLSELVRITVAELPLPKPKKKKEVKPI